jgi:hypothetical protein
MKRKNRNAPGRAYERRRQARIRAGKPEPQTTRQPKDVSLNRQQMTWIARVLLALRGNAVCLGVAALLLLQACTPLGKQ